MTSWWKRASRADEITGAEINRLAAEIQVVAGGRGVSTNASLTAIATALGNEVVAKVQRNPNLNIDELLDLACEQVREMARVAANPSPVAPKDKADLTEHEFAQLTMRIINTATHDTTATDSMAATAKALGMLIAMFARRPEVTGFDEVLRWSQNAVVGFARDARSKFASTSGSS